MDGLAGRFSFVALSVTIGAGLAYLAIASVIADLVLQKCLPDSDKYEAQKNRFISAGSVQLSEKHWNKVPDEVDEKTKLNPTTWLE